LPVYIKDLNISKFGFLGEILEATSVETEEQLYLFIYLFNLVVLVMELRASSVGGKGSNQ
jgi:hypothetical protein